jgi:two-component system chemotaxis sensor kinase CheA
MNLDAAFQTFIVESTDLLQDMEDKLLAMESTSDQGETINSIFRAAHTIKGSAGLFGLDTIVKFTHVVESVLDRVRNGSVQLDEQLVNVLLLCKDYIARMIDSIEDGREVMDDQDRQTQDKLVGALSVYSHAKKSDKTSVIAIDQAQTAKTNNTDTDIDTDTDIETVSSENWHISLHFDNEVLRNGMDPLSFIRYLGTLGQIENIITLYNTLPDAGEMDPEACYLAYEISFNSQANKVLIESAFDFVRDDSQINILPPHGKIVEYLDLIETLSNEELKLGDILVRCGSLTPYELDKILKLQISDQAEASIPRRKRGEIAVTEGFVQPVVVDAALQKQEQIRKSKDKQQQSIRVDADKLDTLINLIGELVIAGAGIETEVRLSEQGNLVEASQTLIRMIEEVRDSALNLRMVQIGDTFNRFQRVVRDVSKELGKEIDLQITGGETELDKTVVEKISDPLTHLVRNAIDHGIEPQEVRIQRGKPAMGTVRLNAYHESGSIVVEVADDGGGLSRDKILHKAIDKGLVSAEQNLSDSEVYNLIFEAGFSTAEQVSNLSGRGVGMDVVRRNIEALRGTIELVAREGAGTTIRIRLPLTLAIIDGFMMGVGKAAYVVPLDIVEECMELTDLERKSGQGQNVINLRGEVLPFIRLRDHFQETGKSGKRESIVVVKYGNQKAGFVVDRLMGELQTVIKPLGVLFQNLKGISGSTILGSGEVALILDTPSLIQHAINQESRHSGIEQQVAVSR